MVLNFVFRRNRLLDAQENSYHIESLSKVPIFSIAQIETVCGGIDFVFER